MTLEVLQDKLQINKARQELISKGASVIESSLMTRLRRFGLVRSVVMGDWLKSWDVLATLNFLEAHVQKDEPILDIGCYASEVIVALHKLGYTDLTGADLNPDLIKMPHQNVIRYEQTNFMHTKFEDASFQAITSISVIEHGFDSTALLKEMSRLLKTGGCFIASFDYWQDKIDTTGLKFFDMDWMIFSEQDISDFIEQAANFGLMPFGDLHYEGQDTPIDCGGKKYTFGWLVLKKIN